MPYAGSVDAVDNDSQLAGVRALVDEHDTANFHEASEHPAVMAAESATRGFWGVKPDNSVVGQGNKPR
jgi:hypothetical protein